MSHQREKKQSLFHTPKRAKDFTEKRLKKSTRNTFVIQIKTDYD